MIPQSESAPFPAFIADLDGIAQQPAVFFVIFHCQYPLTSHSHSRFYSKSEIRISKFETNRSQISLKLGKSKTPIPIPFVWTIGCVLRFIVLDLFRISNFVLRIFFYLSGSVNVNLLPLPTSLSTQIFPLCSSTIFFAIANPRPVPPFFCAREPSAWRNSSKICS